MGKGVVMPRLASVSETTWDTPSEGKSCMVIRCPPAAVIGRERSGEVSLCAEPSEKEELRKGTSQAVGNRRWTHGTRP